MGLYANIPSYEEFVAAEQAGRINGSRADGYVVFKYGLTTTYSNDWDRITMSARGIVFDEQSGNRLIAFPFIKFFNFNSSEADSSHCSMPSSGIEDAEILEKLDGSLGLIFLDRTNQLRVSTPGSVVSHQGMWATNYLRSMSYYDSMLADFVSGRIRAIVTEIIYPGSRMVLDYGGERKLVVTAVQVEDGSGDYRFMAHNDLYDYCANIGIESVKIYSFADYDELHAVMRDMRDQEGFVLHWPSHNGFRLKMKCEWYLHLHRTISNIHPNRIEEAFKLVDSRCTDFDIFMEAARNCVMNFPEEFREPYNNGLDMMDARYQKESEAINRGIFLIRDFMNSEYNHLVYGTNEYISTVAKEIQNGRIAISAKDMGQILGSIRGTFKLVSTSRMVAWWNDVRKVVDFDSDLVIESDS